MKLEMRSPNPAQAPKAGARAAKAQSGAPAKKVLGDERQGGFGAELAEAQRNAVAAANALPLQLAAQTATPQRPAATTAEQKRPKAGLTIERAAANPSPAVTALARRAALPAPLSVKAPAVDKPGRRGAHPARHAEPEKAREAQAEPKASAPSAQRKEDASLNASGFGRELASQAAGAGIARESAEVAPVFEVAQVAAPVFTRAAEDPTLTAALMPGAAHVTCAVDGAGELELHLRIRDGVADVRADGAAAAQLLNRVSQLEAALAGEGLQLGHFDLSQQSGHPGADRTRDEWQATAGRPVKKAVAGAEGPAAVEGGGSRLHVKA
ncbi:MAG: hypothetical protein QM765_39310 [Myxococcales bacterium]